MSGLVFRRINDADWEWVQAAAKKRPEWSSHNPRKWGDDNELKGCIGELVYGRASGQDPADCLKYIPGGDHGYDYEPGVNVCASKYPSLMVQEWRIEAGRKKGVKHFALVVCLAEGRDVREAAYGGYATIDEIAAAPINENLPHPAHMLRAADLHQGFPSA